MLKKIKLHKESLNQKNKKWLLKLILELCEILEAFYYPLIMSGNQTEDIKTSNLEEDIESLLQGYKENSGMSHVRVSQDNANQFSM